MPGSIEQNTAEVFRRREAFRRNGVPLKRGLLLYGPPGTGKTLLASAVAGLKLATFVYVTAADMGDLDDVRNIFALARKLQPSIIFFEDIDLFADDRSSYSSKAVLGEVLAQLDGFEDNDGLVFIATTNDLEAIDPAVRERPSRFDVVLHLGLPGREARRAILAQNLPPGGADARLLDEASAATEGLSGAQMREVAFLAIQRAILRDAVDEAGRAVLAREDILAAVARLNGNQAAPIGFGRTCEE